MWTWCMHFVKMIGCFGIDTWGVLVNVLSHVGLVIESIIMTVKVGE